MINAKKAKNSSLVKLETDNELLQNRFYTNGENENDEVEGKKEIPMNLKTFNVDEFRTLKQQLEALHSLHGA